MDGRAQKRVVIIHPDGHTEIVPLGVVNQVPMPDGNDLYEHTEYLRLTIDGEVLKPGETGYTCTHCKTAPWSEHVMEQCTACAHNICPNCRNKEQVCKPCQEKEHKKALKEFFLSLRKEHQ